ncbi:MAG: BsuBI/PstI family type II restriction endonuclease [Acidobacteriota bacterium]
MRTARDLKRAVALLKMLDLPRGVATEQTAICLFAMTDDTPRGGLLPGKVCLRDGCRIHDILQFARSEFRKKVAENTRESYRKLSLSPLCEIGLVTRHQLSTNDPNTFYRISEALERLLTCPPGERRALLDELLSSFASPARRRPSATGGPRLRVGSRIVQLSGGAHSQLEKEVVEGLVVRILASPTLLYLGDTARKTGYQNRQAMREMSLPIDVAAALPDVLAADMHEHRLVVVEAVTTTGPVRPSRIVELGALVAPAVKLGWSVVYVSAFPDRSTMRRFIEQLAWGTRVWIAEEPDHVIWFNGPTPLEPGS